MKRLIFFGVLLLAASDLRYAPAQDSHVSAPADVDARLREFDAVSIKPNKSDNGAFELNVGHDRVTARNAGLQQLLMVAYDIRPELISGVSGALNSARFDLEAKAFGSDSSTPAKLSDKELEAMLVLLLENRFRLKTHFETKVQPVFNLVTAKGGTKLVPGSVDAKDGNYNESWSKDSRQLTATRITVENLADFLSGKVQRTVIDTTGLEGRYDFNLKWSSDDGTGEQQSSGPSIYTALEEQLGLKLQTSKAPVKSLVVDHAEMPSEN